MQHTSASPQWKTEGLGVIHQLPPPTSGRLSQGNEFPCTSVDTTALLEGRELAGESLLAEHVRAVGAAAGKLWVCWKLSSPEAAGGLSLAVDYVKGPLLFTHSHLAFPIYASKVLNQVALNKNHTSGPY